MGLPGEPNTQHGVYLKWILSIPISFKVYSLAKLFRVAAKCPLAPALKQHPVGAGAVLS